MLKSCTTGRHYYVKYYTNYAHEIFSSAALCIQMVQMMKFYQYEHDGQSFSSQPLIRDSMSNKIVSVDAYCLLPQEYHLLITQAQDNGIYTFIKKTNEAITRYYNLLFKRTGRIFRKNPLCIEVPEEMYTQVVKNIHELPLYAITLRDAGACKKYPWSSQYGPIQNDQERV